MLTLVNVLHYLFATLSGVLACLGFAFAAQCLFAPSRRRHLPEIKAEDSQGASPAQTGGKESRLATTIVIPAHNEASGIAATLDGLGQLGAGDCVLVIADNCSDETASIARAHGAVVSERHDPDNRGKGFALAHAYQELESNPPATVIVIDADCRVEPGALDALILESQAVDRPVQADYLLVAPPDASAAKRVAAFALLVKNRVRPSALQRFGLPCPLTGSGMAFPWDDFAAVRSMGANIVEDLSLGVALSLRGHPARYCSGARVTSEFPTSARGTATQRSRWESGHLATITSQVPRLLGHGLRKPSLQLLAQALDLAIPPLALLIALLVGASTLSLALFLLGAPPAALTLCLAGLLAIGLGTSRAWWTFGRETVGLRDLATIPAYILSKLPLYARTARSGQDSSWVRTERDPDAK